MKFGLRLRTWDTPALRPNFKKNRLRGIPLFGKFIPKITNFGDFRGVSPHFKSENSEIWRECTDPGHPAALNFVKKSLRGICPLGEIFTKNSKFSRFLAT